MCVRYVETGPISFNNVLIRELANHITLTFSLFGSVCVPEFLYFRNHISTLQRGDLRRLKKLRALDLSVNNIRRLHAEVFADNRRLRNLQLSRNPLSSLMSSCFSGLAELRRLSLAFVPTVEVAVAPDVFSDLPALKALNLDSSPAIVQSVMTSDSLLSSLSGVQELGLLNTQLTILRPDLPRLSSFRRLSRYSFFWGVISGRRFRLTELPSGPSGRPSVEHPVAL